MARKPRLVPRLHDPTHPFDRRHGTDTGGLLSAASLATGHPNDRHITAYYGVAPSILNALIDLWLGSRPAFSIERYTFLDIGAGKGRALLTASRHPFAQVVGIELHPALTAIARANIDLFTASASPLAPVEIVQADILTAAFPATPTLAFLFHPFEAPVLRRLLARLEQAFAARPGALDLLYVNAEHAAVFEQHPAYTRLFSGNVPMSSEDHLADLAAIATQTEYGSTGDERCAIYRFTGRVSSRRISMRPPRSAEQDAPAIE